MFGLISGHLESRKWIYGWLATLVRAYASLASVSRVMTSDIWI